MLCMDSAHALVVSAHMNNNFLIAQLATHLLQMGVVCQTPTNVAAVMAGLGLWSGTICGIQ